MKKLTLSVIALAAIASSCTWVKPTEKAASIAVTNASNVRGCELLREITVSGTAKVGFIQRDADKVATELETLARNEAANFFADTIVPSSTISDGRRSYNAYKCSKK